MYVNVNKGDERDAPPTRGKIARSCISRMPDSTRVIWNGYDTTINVMNALTFTTSIL